jgi:hypothetical protein
MAPQQRLRWLFLVAALTALAFALSLVAVLLGCGVLAVAAVRIARIRRWLSFLLAGGLVLTLLAMRIALPDKPVARALEEPWRFGRTVHPDPPAARRLLGRTLVRAARQSGRVSGPL